MGRQGDDQVREEQDKGARPREVGLASGRDLLLPRHEDLLRADL